MTEFMLGLQCGVTILTACVIIVGYIFTFIQKCGKIYKDKKVAGKSAKSGTKTAGKSAKSDNSIKSAENELIKAQNDRIEKEVAAARAAIRNFYLYDGSEQKDPFDIAEEEMAKKRGE